VLRTTAAHVRGDAGAQWPLLCLTLGCWLFIAVVVVLIFVIATSD
jgi:hypothetical protein